MGCQVFKRGIEKFDRFFAKIVIYKGNYSILRIDIGLRLLNHYGAELLKSKNLKVKSQFQISRTISLNISETNFHLNILNLED